MRKVFLMLSVSLFSLNAEATICTPTPDCASLGYKYSLEECKKGAVRCPNGNSYYCPNPVNKCAIGDIYYSDKTCLPADKHDSSKTVLGVVVYITDGGKHGQIMAPWPIDANGNKASNNEDTMIWGYGMETSGLPTLSIEEAPKDFDSCNNTDKMLATEHYSAAAQVTKLYAPTTGTKGKWCLPAAGIMTNIYNNQTAIQNAISNVGGVAFPNCCTWSSSRPAHNSAWASNFKYSYGLDSQDSKADHNNVRPVLEF